MPLGLLRRHIFRHSLPVKPRPHLIIDGDKKLLPTRCDKLIDPRLRDRHTHPLHVRLRAAKLRLHFSAKVYRVPLLWIGGDGGVVDINRRLVKSPTDFRIGV